MKEVYKIRVYSTGNEISPEFLEFFITPILGLLVYQFYIGSIELYQKIAFTLLFFICIVWFVRKRMQGMYLRIVEDEHRNLGLEIVDGNKIKHWMERIELYQYGWNYRFSQSLSPVKVYSYTHRTNHNLIIVLKSKVSDEKLILMEYLFPWESVPHELEYLQINSEEGIKYRIRKAKTLINLLTIHGATS